MALDYEDYWMVRPPVPLLDDVPSCDSELTLHCAQMWGEGRHPKFRELLDTKLSPFLTSHAYQFWRQNDTVFDKNFYYRG